MPYRQTTVAGFPAIALRSAEIEVVVVPGLGMQLSHLRRLRGREWLRRGSLPERGGWNECFPTAATSPLPGAAPGSPPLPERGELAGAAWTSSVYEAAEGTTLSGTTRGARLPFELQREVTLERTAPVARMRYRLRHTGGDPFPWIWSPQASFNVQRGTTVELVGVNQVKLDAVHGREDLSAGDVVSWPGAVGGAPERLTFPDPAGWAVKLYGDQGPAGRAVITDPRAGERLELVVDRSEVPQVGAWIDCGWSRAGADQRLELSLAPCIGAPDRLEEAVGDWGLARALKPGEEVGWELALWLPEPESP